MIIGTILYTIKNLWVKRMIDENDLKNIFVKIFKIINYKIQIKIA